MFVCSMLRLEEEKICLAICCCYERNKTVIMLCQREPMSKIWSRFTEQKSCVEKERIHYILR